jgi:5-methylcytosine-specific restriction endonuclease McrA
MTILKQIQLARIEVKSLKKDFLRIARNDYTIFRASEQGQLLKQALYKAQEGICNNPQCCLSLPITHLQMDHIKPISKSPSLATEPTNFQLLCGPCNVIKSNQEKDV